MFSKRFTKALEDWYGSNWMLSDAWDLATEQRGFENLTRTDLLEFNRLIGTKGRYKLSNEALTIHLLSEPVITPYWVQYKTLRNQQLEFQPNSIAWRVLSDKLSVTIVEAKANLPKYDFDELMLRVKAIYEQT